MCGSKHNKRYDSTGLFTVMYIAAYIQVQYRVTGVHPTGLTVVRGVGRSPQMCIYTRSGNLVWGRFLYYLVFSINSYCSQSIYLQNTVYQLFSYLCKEGGKDPEDAPVGGAGDVHEVDRGDREGDPHPQPAKHSPYRLSDLCYVNLAGVLCFSRCSNHQLA
jgi:hypothetical protein